MNLLSLFKKRLVWRIAVYKVDSPNDIFDLERLKPLCFIGAKTFRKDKTYPTVSADPFLFVHNKILYLFYELKTDHGHGEICATVVSPDGVTTNIGIVLGEPFHLSYPQVFAHNNEIYMLPEAAASGRVLLYRAKSFPNEWVVDSILIDEVLVDPTLLRMDANNRYLLATTRDDSLKIFEVDNALRVNADSCQISNVDKTVSRCGGSPLNLEAGFVRVAQKNTTKYGESVAFYKVMSLSGTYAETLLEGKNVFTSPPSWASEGHHHVSVARFEDEIYVAVDGYARDHYYNTLLLAYIVVKDKFGSLARTSFARFRRYAGGDEPANSLILNARTEFKGVK